MQITTRPSLLHAPIIGNAANVICNNTIGNNTAVFRAKKSPKTAVTEMFNLLKARIAEYNFTCKLLRHTIRGTFLAAIKNVVNLFAPSYSQLQDYYVEFSTAMLAGAMNQSTDSAARHIKKMLVLGFLQETDIAPTHKHFARFNTVYRVDLTAINSEAIAKLIEQEKEDDINPNLGLLKKHRKPRKQVQAEPVEGEPAQAVEAIAVEATTTEGQQPAELVEDVEAEVVFVEAGDDGDGQSLYECYMTDEEAAQSPYVSPAKFEASNLSPCIAVPVYCVMPFYANLTQLNRKITNITNQLKINDTSFCIYRNLRHIFNSNFSIVKGITYKKLFKSN
ncbi:hypothetical protein SAMN05421780_104292 [Flexibacter flexilis DSM 6793]|uniref:Uncharacterized protein n=1 Tax=Flexibacter flexilis DSM 6793 TaxID=927664 RepID=A0A1I1IBD8_9BACT|nr:hypothetical protein [Flexibacter flexilis]SFC33331.1 hypothetical protein SAMN05421780_104292 [Flexibacter flexilis DSM 6793]